MSTQRIALVGAGPAGLTAAIAGSELGMDVTVFEQAPDFDAVGGGILIHSNGQRVLDALGLLDSFLPTMRLTSSLVAEEPGGRSLNKLDFSTLSIPHNRGAVIMRYQLQEHLLSAAKDLGVPIHFNHRCTGLSRDGKRPRLRFHNGNDGEFDVIVACDGVHSKVREAAGIRFNQVAIGTAWIRGVADVRTEDPTIREIWGRDGRRFGIAPLPGNQTYFYCRVPIGEWNDIVETRLESWIESWREFGSDAARVLRSVSDWSRVNYSELHEIRMRRWYKPPVFFTGDAAHAMTPNLGQGANSSMVDALVLMKMLAEARRGGQPLEEVGRRYDELRRPFVTRIQRVSHWAGDMANWTSAARRIRDGMFALTHNVSYLRKQTMLLVAGYNREEEDFFQRLTDRQAPPTGLAS